MPPQPEPKITAVLLSSTGVSFIETPYIYPTIKVPAPKPVSDWLKFPLIDGDRARPLVNREFKKMDTYQTRAGYRVYYEER